MMLQVRVGTHARVAASFHDEDGNAYDPAAVTCRVVAPDGTATDYVHGTDDELVRSSEGEYHLWAATTAAGIWSGGFLGDDADADVTDEVQWEGVDGLWTPTE